MTSGVSSYRISLDGNFLSEGMFSIRVIIDSHSGQGSDIVDFNNIISFYVIDHLFEVDFKNRHYFFIALMAIFGLLFSQFYLM